MNTQNKPTLQEAANRNGGISPERVKRMQQVVKELENRGLLTPSKYRIGPEIKNANRRVTS